jgi:hypothetical protein
MASDNVYIGSLRFHSPRHPWLRDSGGERRIMPTSRTSLANAPDTFPLWLFLHPSRSIIVVSSVSQTLGR